VGVTCTTIRRPHRAQYRGGSSALAARQAPCSGPVPGSPSGSPHRSQYPVSLTAAAYAGPCRPACPRATAPGSCQVPDTG